MYSVNCEGKHIKPERIKTMTYMYRCDKCGKMFSDYDECAKHEQDHWILDRWSELDGILDSMTEYKEGQEEPNIIHVKFTRWNSEKGENETRCGKFKLVSSYEAPLVIENE